MRGLVTFAYLNLVEDSYPSLTTNTNALDLILCRNVAIYLPEASSARWPPAFNAAWRRKAGSLWARPRPTRRSIASLRRTTSRRDGLSESRRPPVAAVQPVTEPASLPLVNVRSQLSSRDRSIVGKRRAVATPADLCQEGLACMEQGCYQAAIDRLLACVAREPTHTPAYYHLARAYANRGQLAEAVSWCQQAIERDPLRTEAHYTLALILPGAGRAGPGCRPAQEKCSTWTLALSWPTSAWPISTGWWAGTARRRATGARPCAWRPSCRRTRWCPALTVCAQRVC